MSALGPPVRLDVSDGVAVVTLDRPERKNAIDAAMLDALEAIVGEVRSRADVRALVLTGAGRAFCSGVDVSTMGDLAARGSASSDGDAAHAAILRLYAALSAIETVEVPTIAAVNGAAIGGGLGLALLCDLRILASDAKIGATFARLGIHPGLGITSRLPARVGYEAAAELLFVGDTISGDEAARMGLARRAVPAGEVVPAAMDLARRIARAAPLSVRRIKETLREATRLDLTRVLALEARAQADLARTADASEGFAAILARREPIFSGR